MSHKELALWLPHGDHVTLSGVIREDFAMDWPFLLAPGPVLRQEQHPDHRLRVRTPAHHLVLLLF